MLFRRWRTQRSGQVVLASALYQHDRRDRERVDRWWAAGGDDRDKVWRGAWFLLRGAYFRFGNHERPERVAPTACSVQPRANAPSSSARISARTPSSNIGLPASTSDPIGEMIPRRCA